MEMICFAAASVADKFNAIWERLVCQGGIIIAFILAWIFKEVGYPSAVIDFIVLLMIFDVVTKFYVVTVENRGRFSPKLLWETCFVENEINSKKLKTGLFAKIFVYFIMFTIAEQSTIDGLIFKDGLKFLIFNGICTVELYSVMENITKIHPNLNFVKRWVSDVQSKHISHVFQEDGKVLEKDAEEILESKMLSGTPVAIEDLNKENYENIGSTLTNIEDSDEWQ